MVSNTFKGSTRRVVSTKKYIAFLWHMHQPYYRDPYTGKMELPWTRMHGLKDYYGMVNILEEFPRVKATYNLVPSLLLQIEQYLGGGTGLFMDVFRKDAGALSVEEIHFLVRHFFSANYQNLVKPYPRYRFLYDKKERLQHARSGQPAWEKIFDTREIRDLQVWFTLCHFDETYKSGDPRVKELLEKGEGFTEADKRIIEEVETEILSKIIPEYTRFAEKGQVEISTTPFYHPILPLLLDPQEGRAANPSLPKYDLQFHWPEDARRQIETALDYMKKTFGRVPVGIWPSEGSLSRETLDMFDDMGIKWTATDEANLAKSLGIQIDRDHRFHVRNPRDLYRSYCLGGQKTRLFFRDRHLSDLIGFHYRGMPYRVAARDLVDRIKHIDFPGEKHAVVPIILDGENAWEHYPGSGREFLKEVFRLIDSDEELETVTFSEAVELEKKPRILKQFKSGSWINGNFDIWIGDEEDRRGWRLLEKAWSMLEAARGDLTPEQLKTAREYLAIAQGSDWFWWFGSENFTAELDIFDGLFRKNLQKVYDVAGKEVPVEFSVPVCGGARGFGIEITRPTCCIHPKIDGSPGSYFQWLHAGRFEVGSIGGAMNIHNPLVDTIFYGFDQTNFYLRIDTKKDARYYLENDYTLDIFIKKDSGLKRFKINPVPQTVGIEGEIIPEFAVDRIVEAALPLALLELSSGDEFYFQLEWKFQGRFFQLIPAGHYFHLTVPTKKDYADCWLV